MLASSAARPKRILRRLSRGKGRPASREGNLAVASQDADVEPRSAQRRRDVARAVQPQSVHLFVAAVESAELSERDDPPRKNSTEKNGSRPRFVAPENGDGTRFRLLGLEQHGPVVALNVPLALPAPAAASGGGDVEDEQAAGPERAVDAPEQYGQRAGVVRLVEQVTEDLAERGDGGALGELGVKKRPAYETRLRRPPPRDAKHFRRLVDP